MMKNHNKTREQLLKELEKAKERIAELERSETQSKQTERALRKSEEQFRLITENTSDLITLNTLDLKASYTYVSPSIKAISGYEPEDMLGRSAFEFIHPDDKKNLFPLLKKYVNLKIKKLLTGKELPLNETIEYRAKDKSGIWHYFQSTGNIMGDQLLFVSRDITERKQAEKALRESESQKQAILDGITTNLAFVNENLEILWVNKASAISVGKLPEEMIGHKCYELWADPEKPCDGCPSLKAWKTRKSEHKIMNTPDGRVWDERGEPVFDQNGELIGMVEIAHDITKRKKAEEALKESEQRFRFMAENTGDVLYRLQHDTMTFRYLSPTISILTGYTDEEINKIGFKSLIDQTVIPGVPDPSFEELIKKRMEGTTCEWRAEYKILSKGGEEKWLGDHSSPWKDDSGKIIGSTGILQDITERKRAELDLAKHREHLEDLIEERTNEVERSQKSLVLLLEDVNEVNLELKSVNTILDATNKELEAFSYSVSHDLRAPLTRMDGFSKALIDSYSNNMDDKAVHFLNRIRVSSQHMAKLIDDLISLSRITREKVTRQKVDLSQTADKIAEELKASEPGRQVNFEIAKGLSANADRKFVVIILENLLGNAFKFTGKKKNTFIEFGEKIINKDEVFFIKDNGAGFNMKYYNKIFTAFQRLHSDKEFKGSGIGLAIVQRIINKHGGKIWAESEVGEGTTFYFKFE